MTRRARYVKRSKPYKERTCLVALQLADEDPHGLNTQVEDPFLLDCYSALESERIVAASSSFQMFNCARLPVS